jgi:hypothetical protein
MAGSRDPFYSPKSRLKRANDHIGRLHKRVKKFFKQAPYRQVTELDADGTQLHKVKFTKRLPESCNHVAAETSALRRPKLNASLSLPKRSAEGLVLQVTLNQKRRPQLSVPAFSFETYDGNLIFPWQWRNSG